jgi:hypothetical protein
VHKDSFGETNMLFGLNIAFISTPIICVNMPNGSSIAWNYLKTLSFHCPKAKAKTSLDSWSIANHSQR